MCLFLLGLVDVGLCFEVLVDYSVELGRIENCVCLYGLGSIRVGWVLVDCQFGMGYVVLWYVIGSFSGLVLECLVVLCWLCFGYCFDVMVFGVDYECGVVEVIVIGVQFGCIIVSVFVGYGCCVEGIYCCCGCCSECQVEVGVWCCGVIMQFQV